MSMPGNPTTVDPSTTAPTPPPVDTTTAPAPTDPTTSQPGTTGPATVPDPGGPYLFLDTYVGDFAKGVRPQWDIVAQEPSFCGVILKAYEANASSVARWFSDNWAAVRAAGGDRYGTTWFRGAYMYTQLKGNGAAQADAYLMTVDAAGGWDFGDMIPIVDVEMGNPKDPKNPNLNVSAQQIIDTVTAVANRIREVTGRRVMLYGRGAMRDKRINDRMGCDVVWNPSWTSTMARTGLDAWALEEIVLWQYAGDNQGSIKTLPLNISATDENNNRYFKKGDISVFIKGAESPTMLDVFNSLIA